MTCFRGRSDSPSCTCHFFSLKYLVGQDVIYFEVVCPEPNQYYNLFDKECIHRIYKELRSIGEKQATRRKGDKNLNSHWDRS